MEALTALCVPNRILRAAGVSLVGGGSPPWRSRSSWRLRCCSPIRRPGVAELGAGPIVFAVAALAAAVDCLRLPQWRGSGAVVAVRPAASLIVAAEPQSRPRHPGDDHGIPAAERRTPRPPDGDRPHSAEPGR